MTKSQGKRQNQGVNAAERVPPLPFRLRIGPNLYGNEKSLEDIRLRRRNTEHEAANYIEKLEADVARLSAEVRRLSASMFNRYTG